VGPVPIGLEHRHPDVAELERLTDDDLVEEYEDTEKEGDQLRPAP